MLGQGAKEVSSGDSFGIAYTRVFMANKQEILEIIDNVPLNGRTTFNCANTEDLYYFYSTTVKLIYDLEDEGYIEVIGDPVRENITGHSFVSSIIVRRIR